MKNIIKQGGWLFLLLCIALIMNNRLGYITMIGMFIVLALANGFMSKTKMDSKGWFLLVYCVFYIILSALNGFNYPLSTLVLYLFAPPVFYYYGTKISSFCDTESDFVNAWFLVVLCYALDVIVTGVNGIIESGSFFCLERQFSFYDGQDVSATMLGLPLNIGVVGLPMFFLCSKKQTKISYLLLAIFSTLIISYLLNRTGLVILCLCTFFLVAIKSLKDTKFLISIIVLAGIISGVLLASSDIFNSDLFSLYAERNAEEGLVARSDRWLEHISNLIIHPLGWAENGKVYYIHNMWLDIARVSGILPFGILLSLSVSSFWKAFRCVLKYRTESAYLIFGLNTCFFLSCFVEPIYGGTHFMLYCLLWGSQSYWYRRKRASGW